MTFFEVIMGVIAIIYLLCVGAVAIAGLYWGK